MLCITCDRNYRMTSEKYCPPCLVRQLKDKLHRRNMQIKDLKAKQTKMFNDCEAYNKYLQATGQNDDFAEWYLNR